MTCQVSEKAVRVFCMKHLTPVYIGGGVIVAIMALAVFVGGANAGDCTCGQSAEAFAANDYHCA